MIKSTFLAASFILILFTQTSLLSLTVDEHGIWHGDDAVKEHKTDYMLADALAEFFTDENAKSVVDLGCGTGSYVKVLRQVKIKCDGFDGNPNTPKITDDVAQVADLSQPLDLCKRYDWVLSLEVGENIPKEFEENFIRNLDRHNIQGIVLSWAVEGQGGFYHFNERNNDYIKKIMENYGYTNDIFSEKYLRSKSSFWWFKNSLMVFRKK